MSTARSVFTEAIEDHLSLKKQNLHLEVSMPIARYDVGDPLDRYPGGRGASEDGTVLVADGSEAAAAAYAAQVDTAPQGDVDATQLFVGPSPEQAMEAATALEPAFAGQPFEPLGGMTPMLSLVEDIEEEGDDASAAAAAPAADVLRFPGGVGPREDEGQAPAIELDETGAFSAIELDQTSFTAPEPAVAAGDVPAQASFDSIDGAADAATGEQPVLVIDADEPFGQLETSPATPPSREGRRKPRFFGMGRKKASKREQAEGWFTDGPRDFNWD